MRLRSVFRDLALACVAVLIGWWLHKPGTVVLARDSGPASDAGLAFQLSGIGPDTSLTVYNPDNRTLYVYQRIGQGNSHISCGYSFTISKPGAPIDRQNCPIGDQVPH